MSNAFKTNSRFAALSEDIAENKEKKRRDGENRRNDNRRIPFDNRNDRHSNNNFNRNTIEEEEMVNKMKKEKLEKEKREKNLAIENFPELCLKNKKIVEESNDISFLDKVKTKVIKETKLDNDLDFENLKPGWVLIKRDKETGKIMTKSKSIYNYDEIESDYEKEIGLNIVNALVNLHNKRKEQYINLWGYNEWEFMFRFPNYDYEYFDKLDEEEELFNEEEEKEDEEIWESDYYY